MSRLRRGALTVLTVILLAAAVIVILSVGSPANTHGSHLSSSATGSARVRYRNLIATDTQSGTLSYADPQTVYAQLAGTITWLPAPGAVISPGHALFRVDNSPVLLMSGATPAYRALGPSDTPGPDIYELNRNLVRLGFEPESIAVDDVWQAGTTAGVEELQQRLGEAQTGSLALGQVVFLPGRQLIQSQSLTVGATATAGTEVLGTSSTDLVVTVDLPPSSQSEATIGERVTVEMPDGSTVKATVTAVSPVADSASATGGGGLSGSAGSGSTVPVTVTLDKPAKGGGLDQAVVSVNFVQNQARHVLSVPVTALLATAGESFAVQEALAPHKLIPVTTGLFAAGYVEISGRGIHPGLQVTDSQG